MINENVFKIVGQVESFSSEEIYSYKGKKFYEAVISVPRRSGNVDRLPIVIPEHLLFRNEEITVGCYLQVSGEVRMINRAKTEKHNIHVFGFAEEYKVLSEDEYLAVTDKNYVKIEGFICKPPRSRVTSMSNRQITDLLIACNRKNSKSYYLPTICWGLISKMAARCIVGDHVVIEGRFQSRSYNRMNDEGDFVNYSVQEISATSIQILDEAQVESILNSINDCDDCSDAA